MREILLAGEEPDEGSATLRSLVSNGAAKHRVRGLECVEHRPLGRRFGDAHSDFAIHLRQDPQMLR